MLIINIKMNDNKFTVQNRVKYNYYFRIFKGRFFNQNYLNTSN